MTVAIVTLDKVCKTYPGGVQAVKSMDLTVRDEEFIVLVGPSGCGKSTTLRMIAGLEEITSGEIRIADLVVNDMPPKDRDIAMVFQNYALYPHMTVFKNMAFALTLRRAPKDEIDRRVREAAAVLGITELLDRKPSALSGGQRQRVAVGRAIVRDPKAFLFDEPLSNLDAKLRVEMRAELKRLHRRLKTTTVYVTHDQEEAMTLGDRIVVMHEGVVQQCAAPLEVYDHPANRFVAGFVGTPPMNFLPGELVAEEGEILFRGGGARLRVGQSRAELLAGRVGGEAVLGVRPEMISSRPEGRFAGGGNELPVKVSVVELLGDKQDVHMTTADERTLVARVDSHQRLQELQETRMYLDMNRVHFFEPGDAGMNLCLSGAEAGVQA
jgi:multiple sugar transport system ATP-binding protein